MNTLCKSLFLLVGMQLTLWPGMVAADSDEWEHSFAPLFLWGMSVSGNATIDGMAADLDLDFKDDIFENMEAALTLHYEARKGDWLLFAEYQYVNLTPSLDNMVGPIEVSADVDFTIQMAEIGLGYAYWRSETTLWEMLGGVRLNDHDLDVDVDLRATPPLPDGVERELSTTVDGGDDWDHLFFGMRLITEIAPNWSFVLRGDVALGGANNEAFHVNAMVDYRFDQWGSVFGGYRHMDFDYEGSSYAYNARQSGPMLGLAFYW